MSKSDKPAFVLREFVRSLSDADLIGLYDRLVQNYPGDMLNATDFLFSQGTVSKILSRYESAKELYSVLDEIVHYMKRELEVRSYPVEIRELVGFKKDC